MFRLLDSVVSVPTIKSLLYVASRKLSSSSRFTPVTHCLFDMDGLLLDTEYIYEDSVRQICRSFGKEYPWDVRMKVMGTTEQSTANIVITELKLPVDINQFLILQNDIVRKEFRQLNLMKGAERLLRHLHESNVPICLATSSGKEMAEIKMGSHKELFKLFVHYVMGSTDPEVKHGKPAPDIFLIAANRFKDKPDPDKCLVFEDSPNGVKAGASAGMQTVMVPDFKLVPPEKRTEATIVLQSLEDFKPELFGLPKF